MRVEARLPLTVQRSIASSCLVLAAAAAVACTTPERHTVGGYTPAELATLEAEARSECAARRGPADLPPHPFTTDGCSMFPDGSWRHCCVAHDKPYWCGGTAEQRVAADDALQMCVAQASSPALGWLMRMGVRLGGMPWVPAPWRWGYGWPWPRRYDRAR